MWLILLLYALFASVFTAAKIGLEHAEPLFTVGFRMLLASFLLLAYYKWRYSHIRVPRHCYRQLFGLGIFNIYLTNALEFWGLQYLSSSKACFLYSLSPFLAAFLSFCLLGERLSLKKSLGLLVGFTGFFPLLYEKAQGELLQFAFISSAELALIGAASATVYGWILMRQLVEKGLSPILLNGFSMLLGGLLALGHSLLVESWKPIPLYGDWKIFSVSCLWMIFSSSLVCYNLYGYLLKRYTVTFMSFAGFITPFFVSIFGKIFLQESLERHFFLSAAMVFAGLALFYWEELQKEGMHRRS